MKKLIFTIIVLSCLIINFCQTYAGECDIIKPIDLNSKNIIKYLEDQQLTDRINKICSSNICKTINPSDLKRELKNFIDDNIKYLKNKSEDISLEAELKGFKIESISIYCD